MVYVVGVYFSSPLVATSKVLMFFFLMIVETKESATYDQFFEDVLWESV